MTFDEIETQLKQDAAKFASLGALVQFDFGDHGTIYVDATQSPPTVLREVSDTPKTCISTSLETFTKISAGRTSPMMAFTMGKLKIKGDMGLAMKLASILDE